MDKQTSPILRLTHIQQGGGVLTATRSRNTVLLVASLRFFAMTLNWFAVSGYFPSLALWYHLGPNDASLMVASFLLGYGALHIPAGQFAHRHELRSTVVCGLLVESLASILCHGGQISGPPSASGFWRGEGPHSPSEEMSPGLRTPSAITIWPLPSAFLERPLMASAR